MKNFLLYLFISLLLRDCTWSASIPSTRGIPMVTTCICAMTKTWKCCRGSRSSSEYRPLVYMYAYMFSNSRIWPDAASSTLPTVNLTCTPRPPICPTSKSWSRTINHWSTSTVLASWSGDKCETHAKMTLICQLDKRLVASLAWLQMNWWDVAL